MARQTRCNDTTTDRLSCRARTAAASRVGLHHERPRTHVRRITLAGLVLAALVVADVRAATNLVQYTFDAAGNIVAIQRADPVVLGVSGFAPTSGAVGTPVTITGTGFAPTPGGNGVTFNGVAGIVSAATATTLTVAVPAGATTGRIGVAVAGKSAMSLQDFTVALPGVPTIAGFTPAAGTPGAPVSVFGTNFNPATGGTTLKLNQSAATVTSITPTQLTFAVPPATGSGKLRIATAAGSAVSAADFIVPPAGIAATDIATSTRLIADGAPQSIALFAFNKVGLILFDGNAGEWLSLQLGAFVINPAGATISYAIFKPDNTQLSAGTVSSTNLTIHVPQLPAIGTYTIVLRSGTTQVSLDARLEANRFIPGDGSTLAVTRGAGQSTRALIAGAAGEQKALSVAYLATVPAGTSLAYEVASPKGTTFRKGIAFGLGATELWPPFATTGTHAIVLGSTAFTTQTSFRLALDAGVALAVDGAAQSVAVGAPGAGARLNFTGIAGESLGLGITGVAPDPAPAIGSTISVYKPDGNLLISSHCQAGGTECSANLAKLPVTGNYAIIVQPWNGATGSLRVWLSRDVAETLASGVPTRLALARPGQNGRLPFAGAAGELIAVQVRGVATSPAGQGLFVQVNRPDGAWHWFMHLTGTGQTLVAPPLPVAGTYTLFVEPESAAQGAATASMEVLLDPGQNLAVDGPTVASTIAVTGASARYTFAGTAGQSLGLGIGNIALNFSSGATISVYRPDGTTLAAVSCAATPGMCGVNLAQLPTTGKYQVVVRPTSGATGALNATLSTDLAGTLTLGSPLALNLDRPGRNARLTFAGTAGQALRLSWSGVAIAGTTLNAVATLYHPGGTSMSSAVLTNGVAGGSNLPTLPVTGTYTIFIDPAAGTTMGATLTLAAR